MPFHSLLVSKDEKAAATLNPVLAGFGMTAQRCGYSEALGRLTEQKYDAVIIDFDDPHSAALVLQNTDEAASGYSAITVALLGDKTKVRNVFGAGANFILYKPFSTEQAQSTFRAATALIKRERRRSYRVPIQIPVQIRVQNGPEMEGILLDLSEDGMDLLAPQPTHSGAEISAHFSLPDGSTHIKVRGEVAWANSNGQSGVRFLDVPDHVRSTLKAWVLAHADELLPDDPDPVSHCKLSDLSLGGCYVETESPFPERSGIILSLKASEVEVQAEGMVRVMHPGFGMGIEFASRTVEQREHVGNLIALLSSLPGTTPELSVAPRALTTYDEYADSSEAEDMEDPLLELLRNHASLGQEDFLRELRRQRSSEVNLA
jgi:c-di-GMP-binding flagellar brake protein YcgR